jgi:hypothetical protein
MVLNLAKTVVSIPMECIDTKFDSSVVGFDAEKRAVLHDLAKHAANIIPNTDVLAIEVN